MKGFSALLLLIVIGALALGASFLFRENRVKGAKTDISDTGTAGFLVSVVARAETWDLQLHGCTSETQCERISKTGGGATELKELRFTYEPGWDKYQLLKVSVQFGQPKAQGTFRVLSVGDIPGSYEKDSAVFVPVNTVTERLFRSAVFSDR